MFVMYVVYYMCSVFLCKFISLSDEYCNEYDNKTYLFLTTANYLLHIFNNESRRNFFPVCGSFSTCSLVISAGAYMLCYFFSIAFK